MPVHLCLSSIPVVLYVIKHLMKSSKCVDVIEEGKNILTILASSTTIVPEHACALKNRYKITLERSELLWMNNCMSLVLNKHYWLYKYNALYIVNIYSVFFSLSCFVMYNCKYLQRQFFLARKVLIPCKYETNVWSIYKFYIKKLPETQLYIYIYCSSQGFDTL